MSNTFALLGGEVVDSQAQRRGDVLITDGTISEVSDSVSVPEGAHVIDATDMLISPGFVDIQVHFREPGREEAEDIETGSRAAAVGGVTAVQTMANTYPRIDSVEAFRDMSARSQKALCDVYASAAITKNLESKELAPLADLYAAGARTFTDDGECVASARLMREAIETLSAYDDVVLAQHCEDHSLVHDGVMDEGPVSEELGVKGRHRVAEEIIIARDIALMKAFADPKLRYHVLHLSTVEGLDLIRQAQTQGVNVSTEIAPQHLVLTSQELLSGNTSFKMNPPLRTARDVEMLRAGLADGTIAAIATDHAPHPADKKALGITDAPPGMLGVETAFSVCMTYLVETGVLTLEDLVRVMSLNPARIINAHKLESSRGGHGLDIAPGNPANITVFNSKEEWIVDAQHLQSKSINSPWDGQKLTGKVHYTFVRGKMTCEKGSPTQ
ncbi:MAG TPA: dihydroorotase [Acidimicrobiia bacterium]|nr:dihydroorotase [Acidimicrobiia bacterium]